MQDQIPPLLAPYRILDLTDERGMLAGHLLAQLGADVIQVEPPVGSTARVLGPFHAKAGGNVRSLYWEAFAAGKRGVALELDSEDGRSRLLALAAQADVLIESSGPGVMERLGLGPEVLRNVNPRLVYASITAYGSSGPKRDYADSDLTIWASAGPMALTRAAGTRLPLRISVPQTWHHAAADAACGAMMALVMRGDEGQGQHVEVSAQSSAMLCTLFGHLAAAVNHDGYGMGDGSLAKKKSLDLSGSGARTEKTLWSVRDGLVEMHLGIGPAAGRFSDAFLAWLKKIDQCPDFCADWNFVALPDRIEAGEVTLDQLDAARDHVGAVLARYTKNELVTIAEANGLMLAPILTTRDLLESPQSRARGYFVPLGAGGLELPAPFHCCGAPEGAIRPAPAIGEHDEEVARDWSRPRDAGPAPDATGIAGLKVLDLAWVVAGPLIGRALADFGAEVIRVESRKRVDTARMLGPYPDGRFDKETSVGFETCNLGKLGLELDLGREEAREAIRDLVAWADVVIESFLPGQMEKFGLDYEALRAINPGVIMLSSSLTGQTGPTARLPGFGHIGAALSGMKPLVGLEGQPPVGPFGPFTDYTAPRMALLALLAALDRKRRTGQGCHLDISQVETAIVLQAPQLLDCQLSGRVAAARGNRDGHQSPSGVFASAGEDKWVAMSARDDAEWRRLAHLIGGEALASDARFMTLADRKANEDALEDLMAAWAAGRSNAEAEAALQAIGVPAHRIADTYDIVADPQIAHRGAILQLTHPISGETAADAARWQLSGTPARDLRHAPRYGEDNQQVLGEILGYPAERIAALQAGD